MIQDNTIRERERERERNLLTAKHYLRYTTQDNTLIVFDRTPEEIGIIYLWILYGQSATTERISVINMQLNDLN